MCQASPAQPIARLMDSLQTHTVSFNGVAFRMTTESNPVNRQPDSQVEHLIERTVTEERNICSRGSQLINHYCQVPVIIPLHLKTEDSWIQYLAAPTVLCFTQDITEDHLPHKCALSLRVKLQMLLCQTVANAYRSIVSNTEPLWSLIQRERKTLPLLVRSPPPSHRQTDSINLVVTMLYIIAPWLHFLRGWK